MNPATKEKVTKYLNQFASQAASYFEEVQFIQKRYTYFSKFFKKKNLEKAKWKDFQEMGEYIHAFNSLALAKKRALGKPNHEIEHYRAAFLHLLYGEEDIVVRINNLFNPKGKFKIKFFGSSVLSELLGYAFADKYVIYNSRVLKVLPFLGLELPKKRGDKFGEKYIKYNVAIKPIIELYEEIVGHQTELPIALEVDQFFSWMYKECLDDVEIRENAKAWLIAPDKGAKRWEDFYERAYAAIDYPIDDLTQYSREKIKEILQEHYNSEPINASLACFEFTHELEIGDVLIAKKGKRTYLGWGIVSSEYLYDEEEDDFRHYRTVQWMANGEWTEQVHDIVPKTLTEIINPEYFNRIAGQMNIPYTMPPLDNGSVNNNDTGTKYWWLQANPTIWAIDDFQVGQEQFYTARNDNGNKRRIYKYFEEIKVGDMVIGYESNPSKRIKALYQVTKGLHKGPDGIERFDFRILKKYLQPIEWSELKEVAELANCEVFKNNQGSLFTLTAEEFDVIQTLLDEKNPPPVALEPYSKAEALQDLFINETTFDKITKSLKRKKNIILQGPPGVGKTYVVERIAYSMLKEKDTSKVSMVQFHQSYTYEDFIQGIRPTDIGHFDTREGVFYRFCEKAKITPDKPHFFIIDEINRGNLSKIFGELMMLIEADKRGKKYAMPLTYSKRDETFYIPENVYIIGTMNTADRSLALVDYALRRRFAFISIEPNFDNAFKTFLQQKNVSSTLANHIANKMTSLNENIAQENALGKDFKIGHSYFCNFPEDLNEDNEKEWFDEVVEFEVKPLLEEYWFDKPNKVAEELSKLKYQPQV